MASSQPRRALFSTRIGKYVERQAYPGMPVIIRSDPLDDRNTMAAKLQTELPGVCKWINFTLPDISLLDVSQFFDGYDQELHGFEFLKLVLLHIADGNASHKRQVQDYVGRWMTANTEGFALIEPGHKAEHLFTKEDVDEYGQHFLDEAFAEIRRIKDRATSGAAYQVGPLGGQAQQVAAQAAVSYSYASRPPLAQVQRVMSNPEQTQHNLSQGSMRQIPPPPGHFNSPRAYYPQPRLGPSTELLENIHPGSTSRGDFHSDPISHGSNYRTGPMDYGQDLAFRSRGLPGPFNYQSRAPIPLSERRQNVSKNLPRGKKNPTKRSSDDVRRGGFESNGRRQSSNQGYSGQPGIIRQIESPSAINTALGLPQAPPYNSPGVAPWQISNQAELMHNQSPGTQNMQPLQSVGNVDRQAVGPAQAVQASRYVSNPLPGQIEQNYRQGHFPSSLGMGPLVPQFPHPQYQHQQQRRASAMGQYPSENVPFDSSRGQPPPLRIDGPNPNRDNVPNISTALPIPHSLPPNQFEPSNTTADQSQIQQPGRHQGTRVSPSKDHENTPCSKLWLGSIPSDLSHSDIKEMLAPCRGLYQITQPRSNSNIRGSCSSYVFAIFETHKDAEEAKDLIPQTQVSRLPKGQYLIANWPRTKQTPPSSHKHNYTGGVTRNTLNESPSKAKKARHPEKTGGEQPDNQTRSATTHGNSLSISNTADTDRNVRSKGTAKPPVEAKTTYEPILLGTLELSHTRDQSQKSSVPLQPTHNVTEARNPAKGDDASAIQPETDSRMTQSQSSSADKDTTSVDDTAESVSGVTKSPAQEIKADEPSSKPQDIQPAAPTSTKQHVKKKSKSKFSNQARKDERGETSSSNNPLAADDLFTTRESPNPAEEDVLDKTKPLVEEKPTIKSREAESVKRDSTSLQNRNEGDVDTSTTKDHGQAVSIGDKPIKKDDDPSQSRRETAQMEMDKPSITKPFKPQSQRIMVAVPTIESMALAARMRPSKMPVVSKVSSDSMQFISEKLKREDTAALEFGNVEKTSAQNVPESRHSQSTTITPTLTEDVPQTPTLPVMTRDASISTGAGEDIGSFDHTSTAPASYLPTVHPDSTANQSRTEMTSLEDPCLAHDHDIGIDADELRRKLQTPPKQKHVACGDDKQSAAMTQDITNNSSEPNNGAIINANFADTSLKNDVSIEDEQKDQTSSYETQDLTKEAPIAKEEQTSESSATLPPQPPLPSPSDRMEGRSSERGQDPESSTRSRSQSKTPAPVITRQKKKGNKKKLKKLRVVNEDGTDPASKTIVASTQKSQDAQPDDVLQVCTTQATQISQSKQQHVAESGPKRADEPVSQTSTSSRSTNLPKPETPWVREDIESSSLPSRESLQKNEQKNELPPSFPRYTPETGRQSLFKTGHAWSISPTSNKSPLRNPQESEEVEGALRDGGYLTSDGPSSARHFAVKDPDLTRLQGIFDDVSQNQANQATPKNAPSEVEDVDDFRNWEFRDIHGNHLDLSNPASPVTRGATQLKDALERRTDISPQTPKKTISGEPNSIGPQLPRQEIGSPPITPQKDAEGRIKRLINDSLIQGLVGQMEGIVAKLKYKINMKAAQGNIHNPSQERKLEEARNLLETLPRRIPSDLTLADWVRMVSQFIKEDRPPLASVLSSPTAVSNFNGNNQLDLSTRSPTQDTATIGQQVPETIHTAPSDSGHQTGPTSDGSDTPSSPRTLGARTPSPEREKQNSSPTWLRRDFIAPKKSPSADSSKALDTQTVDEHNAGGNWGQNSGFSGTDITDETEVSDESSPKQKVQRIKEGSLSKSALRRQELDSELKDIVNASKENETAFKIDQNRSSDEHKGQDLKVVTQFKAGKQSSHSRNQSALSSFSDKDSTPITPQDETQYPVLPRGGITSVKGSKSVSPARGAYAAAARRQSTLAQEQCKEKRSGSKPRGEDPWCVPTGEDAWGKGRGGGKRKERD